MRAVTLIDALKRMLKAKGITYAVVAEALELSEASVKRISRNGRLVKLQHFKPAERRLFLSSAN